MARHFTITTPAETVRVGPDGLGEMTFTVTNVSGAPTRGLGKIVPLGNTKTEWLTLTEVERDFPVGGVHQFPVAASIPPGTPAGRYTWRLDVVSAAKSGEGSETGPTVAFEVPASEPKKKGIPWWVWVAIAAVAIVVAVVAFLLLRPEPEEKVKVPKLVGRDLGSAIIALQEQDLIPNMKAKFVSFPTRDVNRVVDQDPDPDIEVDRGATVTIVVVQRKGRRPVKDVKDVRGMSTENSRRLREFLKETEGDQ